MPKYKQKLPNGTVVEGVEFTIDMDRAMKDIFKKNADKWTMMVSNGVPLGSSKIHLKDTITFTIEENTDENKLIIYCGKKSYIAHFVEFGTSKMGATPFMRPAFSKISRELEQEIAKIDFAKYLEI